MSERTFREIDGTRDRDDVVAFLTGSGWPFHRHQRLNEEQARTVMLGPPSETRAFWIVEDGRQVGLVRLFDLDDADDGSVQFDLRVGEADRGRGVGRAAVAWLTRFLFDAYPALHRIEASTRFDNVAMRRTLEANEYQLEGRLRQTWLTDDGTRLDTALYGRLRTDGALRPDAGPPTTLVER